MSFARKRSAQIRALQDESATPARLAVLEARLGMTMSSFRRQQWNDPTLSTGTLPAWRQLGQNRFLVIQARARPLPANAFTSGGPDAVLTPCRYTQHHAYASSW